MQLIGAGFGRTGTLSLKQAIEQIGAGPCYHMQEVARHKHAAPWHAAAKGEAQPWDEVFAGFHATVDWPACTFWRELSAYYPEAKVLLSVRDPERWYESVGNTIYKVMTEGPSEGPMAEQLAMVRCLILEKTFGGRFEDRAHAIGVFERHNDAVRKQIPEDRLLVYTVGSGWEPLCSFLDRPIPEEDFPHVNSTEEFADLMKAMRDAQGQTESN
jgi:hypothetical protein